MRDERELATTGGGPEGAASREVGEARPRRALEPLLHIGHAHAGGHSRSSLAGHLRDKLASLHTEWASAPAGQWQARHAALHDTVTSLPNRAHLRQRLCLVLPSLLLAGRPLGLLCLGLWRLERFNEVLGRAAGDESLRIVAARLRHALRAHDVIGRVGEDVFACLLPGIAGPQALRVIAQRLIAAVGAPMRIGSIELGVPASVGVAVAPDDGQGADELLGNARAAMYRAMRQRCDHAFYGQPTGH